MALFAKREEARSSSSGDKKRNMRRRRLEAINARLSQLGLQEFVGLGNYKLGECELVKIISEHRFSRTWIIVYACIWSDGKHGEWSMLYNENPEHGTVDGKSIVISAAHCIVTLNRDRFVVTAQDRRTLDGWNPRPFEITRGFNSGRVIPIGTQLTRATTMPMQLDVANPITSLPLKVVGRKLAPLMSSGLVKIDEMSLMGVSWENSGNARVFTVKSHLGLWTDRVDEVLEIVGTPAMEIHYPTIEEVYDNFYQMGIAGEQCTSTLWYFDRMIRSRW